VNLSVVRGVNDPIQGFLVLEVSISGTKIAVNSSGIEKKKRCPKFKGGYLT